MCVSPADFSVAKKIVVASLLGTTDTASRCEDAAAGSVAGDPDQHLSYGARRDGIVGIGSLVQLEDGER
jgi:hypothetical protein